MTTPARTDSEVLDIFSVITSEFRHRVETIGAKSEFSKPSFEPIVNIPEETRIWEHVKLKHPKLVDCEPERGGTCWLAIIDCQRSDGQQFGVSIWLYRHEAVAPDLPLLLRSKCESALRYMESLRDCSCGILRREQGGRPTKEGVPTLRNIHSACRIHNPHPVDEPLYAHP
jgi:hypothetical protein